MLKRQRIQIKQVVVITSFDDFTFYEKDEINLIAAGTQWFFYDDFNIENTQTFTIPFSNALKNTSLSVKVRAVSTSVSSSSMEVKVNGLAYPTLNFSPINSSNKARASEKTSLVENSSDFIKIEINYNNNGNPSASAYLDFIEVVGKKELKADATQFSFRSFEQSDAIGAVEYQIKNATNIFQVWDVSNFLLPSVISNEATDSSFIFRDNGSLLKEYVVLNESDFYIPETIENSKIVNQNLHGLRDLNYIIITSSELASEAKRLAEYHEVNSGLITKVVLLDEIYNEFSSGSKDITGIRDFIKHIYDTNSSEDKKLKYVCFFGDGSYDYKDRLSGNNNIVPVKLSEKVSTWQPLGLQMIFL